MGLPAALRSRILPRDFYDRPAELVARELLGKVLLHASAKGARAGRVVEVEAYEGLDDPASHIGRGFTPRTRGIFGRPGLVYVYFVYGMHHCVNAIALGRSPYGAVLFRALEPLSNLPGLRDGVVMPPRGAMNGPGRLTRALGIGMELNGSDLTLGPLALLDLGVGPPPVRAGPRVGITRAPERPLRFFIPGNPYVSKPWPWGGGEMSPPEMSAKAKARFP